MATRKNDKRVSNREVSFLQVDLTKAHKAELAKWAEANPDLWNMIEKAVDSRLKFSMSWDDYNNCNQASLTKLPEDGKNGMTIVLIGRGASLLQATQALFFKYDVVLQKNLEDGDIRNARGVTDWG